MAARLPVVVSPFGMNQQVLAKGEIGFGVVSTDDWIHALEELIRKASLRKRMGESGFNVVKTFYDVSVVSLMLKGSLESVYGSKS